jgi:hypothetical protein
MDDWTDRPGRLHVEVGLLTLIAIAVAVAYIEATPMNPTIARVITLALFIALAIRRSKTMTSRWTLVVGIVTSVMLSVIPDALAQSLEFDVQRAVQSKPSWILCADGSAGGGSALLG